MKNFRTIIAALALVTLGLTAVDNAAAELSSSDSNNKNVELAAGCESGWGTYHENGPANCNCTESDAELSVCHQSSVSVTVGSSSVNVTTGLSESTCASQKKGPGKCIYYQYNFRCKSGFWGWTCRFDSSALKERDTNDTDCDDAK